MTDHVIYGRLRGLVVRALDLQSGGPEFKSYHMDLFHGSPVFEYSATLVNSQLISLPPVEVYKNVIFSL